MLGGLDSVMSLLVVAPSDAGRARVTSLLDQLPTLNYALHHSLDEGLQWAANGDCDAVVITGAPDGGESAFDLLWKVRETGRISLPVIVVVETTADAAQARETGAADALSWDQITATLLDRTLRYAVAQRQAEDQLQALQLFDQATGLPTQLLFWEMLGQAVRRAQRAHDHLAVLMLRLDGLQPVLDEGNGLEAEDAGRELATRLQGCLRASDTIARFDDQQLVILVEGMPRLEDVQVVAEKILEVATKPLFFEGKELQPVPTIGISVFPANAATAQGLIADAAEALYVALERQQGSFQFA